ncbi:carbohydrate kinase family protein [Haloglycomyces albus]|uniref:carbohydrate kinase family protein n=1 Tax=Haloglycomyces albus TaxID=526067 RepID=UPI00046C906A|nr:PfkB family carbohydrate kinase [Haloglycomyces albus]
MTELVVLGGVGVDTIVRVPRLDVPGGDSLSVPPIRDFVAHTGNGVALASHELRRSTLLIDFLGADPQGETVLDHYRKAGLEFAYQPAPNGTPRSVNLVDKDGKRFSFYDGRHPYDLRLDPELYRPHMRDAGQVHVSINNVCREVFDHIDYDTTSVSTDLHSWNGVDDHHKEFALRSDVVFLSSEKLGHRTPETMRWIADHGRAHTVIATAGGKGGWALRGDTLTAFTAIDASIINDFGPAWNDWEVVDTNGAGDAFVAGFLWATGKGAKPSSALHAGAIAGAWTVQAAGTHTDFIDEDVLVHALNRLA